MKILNFLLLLMIATAGIAFAGAELFSFQAFPINNQTHLLWQSGVETDLVAYVVERSDDRERFDRVDEVTSTGSYSSYEFVDHSPLMADIERVFYYRLKMVDRDGTVSYSEIRDVQLSFSTVGYTWGSIKAMFR